jgi:sugar phosphate isomerase/epimerase
MIDPSKLAFSTLGCAGESVEQVLAHAAVGGCRGVELRCRAGELIAPDTEFDAARRVGDALRAGGLSPICLATYVQIGAANDVLGDLKHHLELAAAAGVPMIRVFGGEVGDPEVPRRAAQRLRGAGDTSVRTGVAMLLETHDAMLEGRVIASVLDAAAVPTAGAIWDILNPWRAGEEPEATARYLGSWVRHVHIKDAASKTELAPLIPGTGVVPIIPILSLLARSDYRGWVELEWESAWYPDAPPLDDALKAFSSIMHAAR